MFVIIDFLISLAIRYNVIAWKDVEEGLLVSRYKRRIPSIFINNFEKIVKWLMSE